MAFGSVVYQKLKEGDKMKKIIISFLSLITCLSLAVSFVGSAASNIANDIYDNTIFQPQFRTGSIGTSLFTDFISGYIEDLLKDIKAYVNNDTAWTANIDDDFYEVQGNFLQNLDMPNFGYLSGKSKLKWYRTMQQSQPNSVEVQIDLFWCNAYKFDYTPWISWSDGVKIPVNSLVYTITRSNGDVARYFIRPNRSYGRTPYSVVFSVSDDNDYFSLPQGAWDTTVYRITGDETYETAFLINTREKRLYFNPVNDIAFGLPRNSYGTPISIAFPSNQYPREPSDEELVGGYINYNPTNNTSYWGATDYDFWVSYYSTNDTPTAEWLRNSALTADWQQNWYYNDIVKNGDSVTENNYSDKYLDAFAPIFDVDLGDIDFDTIIPQISAGLEPTLRLGIDDLLDALMDFFGNMPDIGLTWNDDTDNNYYDIIPSEPDLPDNPDYTPWEPPEYDSLNTTPFIPATYPEFTVSTIPANIGETMSETLNTGWEFADTMGIIAIAVPCALFVILWRFTGK